MDYGLDQRKIAAREETIIRQGRKLFKQDGLRVDQRVLSLGGHFGIKDAWFKKCEPLHLLDVGFIQSLDQYISVENDPDVFLLNKNLMGYLKQGALKPHMYQGDVVDVVRRLVLVEKKFNPALLNLDFISSYKQSGGKVSKVMEIMNYTQGACMVAWNVVVGSEARGQDFRGDEADVVRMFPLLYYALRDGNWHELQPYEYQSSGRSRTTMRTYTFWRPK